MATCQSRIGTVCSRDATWKQEVRAGDRPTGRVLFFSYWCDEHAARIVKRRETELISPPSMIRIVDTEGVS